MSFDPVKYLFKVDPQLGGVIKIVGKYSIKIRTNAFQSLVESIIYQQLAEALPILSIQGLSNIKTM
ncbi:MAG TPA: hypothetical protein VIP70_06100 [Nitrososphaeraceae archaeon]